MVKFTYDSNEFSLMVAILAGLNAENYPASTAKALIYKCKAAVEEKDDVSFVIKR